MIDSYLTLVKNPNFRRLWLGQVTSQIALNMLYFVLAIRVYQETGSNTAVSFMLLSFGIPAIIFGVIAGGIVDLFDKRSILNFCNISRVFIVLLFFLFSNNLISLYLLSIAISIVTQLFIPAEVPSIAQLVENSQLLLANSLFTISFYLSTVFGFILAGPALIAFGQTNTYLVIALLMLLAFLFTFQLPSLGSKNSLSQKQASLSFMGKIIYEGMLFIRTHKRIEQSLILVTFSQALIATLSVLAPGFSDQVLTIDLKDASILVMGPAAVGLVFGSYLIGSFGKRFLRGEIILTSIIAIGFILIALSFVSRADKLNDIFNIASIGIRINNLVVAMIFLFLIGVFNAIMSIAANTILQEETGSNLRSRIYGVLTAMTGGVSILPVIFSGILADAFGVGPTLLIVGIVVLIIGLYKLLRRQNRDIIIT